MTSTRTFVYCGYFRTSAVERIFQRTSAKQRGEARSGWRTLLSHVCLVEKAGSRDIVRRTSSITEWPSQDCAPAVLSTANVGKRSSIDFRKTVPHLVYYCPDNRTRSFNTTNTKMPLNTILSQFHLISVLIVCLPETRPNLRIITNFPPSSTLFC